MRPHRASDESRGTRIIMKRGAKAALFTLFGVMGSAFSALAADMEWRLVVPCPGGVAQYPSPFSDKKPICVAPDILASDANVIRVTPKNEKTLGGMVEFEFDVTAQTKLSAVAADHVGGQLAILSHGKLITAAMINGPFGADMYLMLPEKNRSKILALFANREIAK